MYNLIAIIETKKANTHLWYNLFKILRKCGIFTKKEERTLLKNGGMLVKREDRKSMVVLKIRFVICFYWRYFVHKVDEPENVHTGFKLYY